MSIGKVAMAIGAVVVIGLIIAIFMEVFGEKSTLQSILNWISQQVVKKDAPDIFNYVIQSVI